ncbi:hypothetical protein DFH06DRAFT_1473375 [Mycena polygramma]|nr:hypothetical protein DFH06DRAFT_1473375 [Mycena polygramma]
MHPSLGLHNLARLPSALQKLATSAANGSQDDLKRLTALLDDPAVSESQRSLFWPVYYAWLDPAGIPYPENLDGIRLTSSEEVTVSGIFFSMLSIHSLPVPPRGAFTDIWNRVWRWIQFSHLYGSALLDLIPAEVYGSPIRFMARTVEKWDDTLVLSTPGVHSFIGAAWASCLENRDAAGLAAVSRCFLRCKKGQRTIYHEEYVDGIGSVLDLASMVVRHIDFALGDGLSPLSETQILLLLAMGIWLEATAHVHTAVGEEFEAALANCGIMRALTKAICAVNGVITVYPFAPMGLACLLSHLRFSDMDRRRRSYMLAIESLRAGLLRAIVLSAGTDTGDDVQSLLAYFLSDLLPALTVYRSVLKHIERGLLDVAAIAAADKFRNSTQFPKWEAFTQLAHERLDFLRQFEEQKLPPSRACDNAECGHISDKYDFKRCYCQAVYYCSRTCQALDWKAGHREVCSDLRKFHMIELHGTRDIAFLRALVHEDYLLNRFEIFLEQLPLLEENPEQLLYTAFDYTDRRNPGRLVILVSPFPRTGWDAATSLVRRSAGKLDVYRVKAYEGSATQRVRPMRMWSNHAGVREALLAIAPMMESPDQAANIQQRVAACIDMDVVTVHQ